MRDETQEPERLSHEWHALEADKNASKFQRRLEKAEVTRGTRIYREQCAQFTHDHRDLAQKLRQAARDAERLRRAIGALRNYADLGGTTWVESDCGDHAKAALKALEAPDAE